jgi:hypothetical protein
MKRSFVIVSVFAICASALFYGCKKDTVETDLPVLRLVPDKVSGKSGFSCFYNIIRNSAEWRKKFLYL